ncbi:MAG: helicase-associated domain-containing protein [Anaerolineales bacterium]|nr:helicase-associated domain-containing protein [Anaerolineales bacterium]
MRTLRNTLHDLEAGDLRIIAARWGIEAESPAGGALGDQLAAWILQPDNLAEFIAGLTDGDLAALDALRRHAGRLPLADAERKFGTWRRMGPARRDRVQPHLNPAGPLESLGYTGLIGRAFADGPAGAQEFVFLPTDLLPLMPAVSADPLAVSPAADPIFVMTASASAVEDLVTLLAALRRRSLRSLAQAASWSEPIRPFLLRPEAASLLLTLLLENGVLSDAPHRPQADQTRRYLQSLQEDGRRPQTDWVSSKRWNDLSQVPSLICETRDWPGDPARTRQALLEQLGGLPAGRWFDLDSLVQAIRDERPGFQRTAGEFEAWYLRDRESGEFLRGFEHWDAIEGALVRFVVCGPLHWLGAADLGSVAPDQRATRFRLTASLTEFAAPASPQPSPRARLDPEGQIDAPLGMPPAHRYQLARFCDWDGRGSTGFTYRLTPSAIRLALGQGLRPPQVVALLESVTGQPLPPQLQQALARMSKGGPAPHLEQDLVLRLADARLLEELLASKSTARFLGDRVGRDGVVVRSGEWPRLRAAAAKMGILIDGLETTSGSRRRH